MTGAVYLDYNATAPVRPAAAEAAAEALGACGNASSVHRFGRAVRARVETARDQVAALVGARSAQVIFTSGGTEANNLALRGARRAGEGPPGRVIVSAVEHDSVVLAAPQAEIAPVTGDGVIDLGALEQVLAREAAPALVSVMLANNETGAIQPVAEAARLAHAHGALVHCDAVQAAGKIGVDMAALGVDLLSLSAHKMGGPPGVGALVVADEVDIAPMLLGGGQERRRRAGTENVPGIAGFGAAAAEAAAEPARFARLAELRDRLEAEIARAAPAAKVFAAGAPRLANTSCIALPGLSADTQVMALDLEGVAVSAGSACSSGKVAPSRVLAAMGAGALADCAIRVSLGWASEPADVDRFLAAWTGVCAAKAKARGPGAPAPAA